MRTSFPTVAFFLLILAGVWTVGATEPFAADDSTIGLWSFDSGEGDTAVDVSRFHHNGTFFGTSERVEGRFGNGIVLASEDAKLSLQNPAHLRSTDRITMELWIRKDQETDGLRDMILAKGLESPVELFYLWIMPDGTLGALAEQTQHLRLPESR